MTLMTILLVLLVLAGLWASMTTLLLRATIALALASALLAVVMYALGAQIAAVLELSVCAGLISVVFVSVISLTQRKPFKDYVVRRLSRLSRFWPLPLILVAAGVALSFVRTPVQVALAVPGAETDVRVVMWNLRQLDLFGQILILLAGVIGVLVLFKREDKDDN
jgi:NADH-quinone oxidoreductase subunit J